MNRISSKFFWSYFQKYFRFGSAQPEMLKFWIKLTIIWNDAYNFFGKYILKNKILRIYRLLNW